jgi:hypothetical protein
MRTEFFIMTSFHIRFGVHAHYYPILKRDQLNLKQDRQVSMLNEKILHTVFSIRSVNPIYLDLVWKWVGSFLWWVFLFLTDIYAPLPTLSPKKVVQGRIRYSANLTEHKVLFIPLWWTSFFFLFVLGIATKSIYTNSNMSYHLLMQNLQELEMSLAGKDLEMLATIFSCCFCTTSQTNSTTAQQIIDARQNLWYTNLRYHQTDNLVNLHVKQWTLAKRTTCVHAVPRSYSRGGRGSCKRPTRAIEEAA